MSINSFRKPAALAAGALVLSGAGFGVAQAASSSSAAGTSAGAVAGAPSAGGGAPGAAQQATQRAALAKALGVSTARLDAAFTAIGSRGAAGGIPGGGAPPTGTPPAGSGGPVPPTGSGTPPAGGASGTPPTGGAGRGAGDTRLAAALAKQLGLPTAKVEAALAAIRPTRGAARPATATGTAT